MNFFKAIVAAGLVAATTSAYAADITGARAAGTMRDARHHEQAQEIVGPGLALARPDFGKKIQARERRDLLVRPTMIDDQLAAAQALAAEVVGIANDFDGDALDCPGSDGLTGRTAGSDADRVFRQPRMSVT